MKEAYHACSHLSLKDEENVVDTLSSTLICDEFTTPEEFSKAINSMSSEVPEEPPDPIQIRINQLTDAQSQLPFIQLQTPSGGKLIALVDTGAQMSIISSQAAQRLQLAPVGRRKLSYAGFIAETGPNWCIFFKLELQDVNGDSWTTCLPSFHRMNTIFRAPNHSDEDFSYLRRNGLHIEGVTDLRALDGQRIDMILGNNVLNKIKRIQQPRMFHLPSGRAVEQLVVGFVNHPPVIDGVFVQVDKDKPVVVSNDVEDIWIHSIGTNDPSETYDHKSMKNLDKQVEELWNLDNVGLSPPAVRESREALNLDLIAEFKKSAIIAQDNTIHVALPYNGRQKDLHSNLPVAKRRLASLLEHQLQKEEDREAYHQIIMKQLEAGIIEEASMDTPAGTYEYYIPHRAVEKEDSLTTKLRIVLDASSHMRKELSLNDCLYPGPSILQSIIGIMIRSRLTMFLMTGDIEKAFHQVHVQEDYRDVTKFLWIRDPSKGFSEDNIIVYRFTRLPFGVSCSPFLLAVTIMKYLEMDEQPFNQRILENLYVDNVMFTSNKEEDIKNCYDKCKTIFDKMHMNVREFACNSPVVTSGIAEKDRGPQQECKLLGHMWNSVDDTITIKIAKPPTGIPTKRQIVAFSAKTYDPSGLVSPIIVKVKLLISTIWRRGLKWNDKLPEDLISTWNEITSTFTESTYTFPRRLTDDPNFKSVQLIMFADASKDHFATTAYLRFEYEKNKFTSRLILAKSKVRPSNGGPEYTIPRMELMAFEIATNAALTILSELHIKIKKVVFFSDSTCCLYWILNKVNNSVETTWVVNRVQKIHKNLLKCQEDNLSPTVRYVPTDENPADIASRGCSLQELRSSSLWNQGPQFLQQTEDHWPKKLDNTAADPNSFHEFATAMGTDTMPIAMEFGVPQVISSVTTPSAEESDVVAATGTVATQVAMESGVPQAISSVTTPSAVRSIIPYERTNSLEKLTRWTSKAVEWMCKLVMKRNQRYPSKPIIFKDNLFSDIWKSYVQENLSVRLILARKLIIRYHYKDAEVRLNEFPPSKLPIALHQDGSWKYKTRFSEATDTRITPEMKLPTIILANHPLAYLIVQEAHEKLNHQGIQDITTEVHTRYWIESLGSIVRKVRNQCLTCRKKHARPFRYDYNRILPPSRTTLIAPFKYIGLDYLGPLQYKRLDEKGKLWVLLITCLVSRAIHLEVVPDNTTISFVNGLRRFISRRGSPSSIVSDNAPQFKLAYNMVNEDLKTIVNQSDVLTSFLAKEEIDIKLITPLSPWQGGVYERLVGLVKTMLSKVLKKQIRSFLEMETLIIETEGIINSRPITPNKKSGDDAPAIRPIDFIAPGVCLALPERTDTVFDIIKAGETDKFSRQVLEGLGRAKEDLWTEFVSRYFHTLKELKKNNATHSMDTPKEGMLVLVESQKTTQRYHWPLGRIIQVTRSMDGYPRSVLVKVGKRILEKSVNQLIPLEDPGVNNEEFVAVPVLEKQEIVEAITPKRGRGRPKKSTPSEAQAPQAPSNEAEVSRETSTDSSGKGSLEIVKDTRKHSPRTAKKSPQPPRQDILKSLDTSHTDLESESASPKRDREFLPRAAKRSQANPGEAQVNNLLSSASPGKQVPPSPGVSRIYIP